MIILHYTSLDRQTEVQHIFMYRIRTRRTCLQRCHCLVAKDLFLFYTSRWKCMHTFVPEPIQSRHLFLTGTHFNVANMPTPSLTSDTRLVQAPTLSAAFPHTPSPTSITTQSRSSNIVLTFLSYTAAHLGSILRQVLQPSALG